MKQLIVALPFLVLGLSEANAVEYETVEAVGVCQSALPVHDANVRKRPLAIANEGATTAFVSCSLQTPIGAGGVSDIALSLKNRSSVSAQVTCTFVEGAHFDEELNFFFPKSVTVSAGSYTWMNWNYTFDNSGQVLFGARFNCALPPGVEIGHIQLTLGTSP